MTSPSHSWLRSANLNRHIVNSITAPDTIKAIEVANSTPALQKISGSSNGTLDVVL